MYHHLGHQRITDCSHENCWVRVVVVSQESVQLKQSAQECPREQKQGQTSFCQTDFWANLHFQKEQIDIILTVDFYLKTKQAKRLRLDPYSAFHQRRTEEKTDGVIFWSKLSPRSNWISCLVQRLPFPDCDVEDTQPLAGTCKNAPSVFAQSDKAQRTMSVFPAGL